MIQIVVGIVLILLHIICCILVWVGICTHIINVKKYLMFPVVFVPVWGVLCVLILHFQIWIQSDQRKEVGVEKMKVNEEIYKNIFQSGTEQEGNIVPLEEALIVNEPELRRELIMNVLNDNPEEYVELLKQARMNEDVEVVHYAITAMVELSKASGVGEASSDFAGRSGSYGAVLRIYGGIFKPGTSGRTDRTSTEAAI